MQKKSNCNFLLHFRWFCQSFHILVCIYVFWANNFGQIEWNWKFCMAGLKELIFYVFRSLKIHTKILLWIIFLLLTFFQQLWKNGGKIGPILVDSVSFHYKICVDWHLGENVMFWSKPSLKIGTAKRHLLELCWPKLYFFRNKTFLFFKIESWNFKHLFEKEFLETSQNFNLSSWYRQFLFSFFFYISVFVSDWVEISRNCFSNWC